MCSTASDVWADTAYRSPANEDFLADRGKTSRIHRKKPRGRLMAKRTAKANDQEIGGPRRRRARVRPAEGPMKLFIRRIGIKRAEATVVMANTADNLGRWRWWQERAVPA